MTTLHIQDEVAATLKSRAEASGLSLEEYLQRIMDVRRLSLPTTANPDDVREFDVALEELFAADTRPLPAMSVGDSREDIYFDHD